MINQKIAGKFMLVTTYSGRKVNGPKDRKDYWLNRRNQDLYRLTSAICKAMFPSARSAIDVGCYTSGLLVEMDWIERRVATDIQSQLVENWSEVNEVDFFCEDAFSLKTENLFDLVLSNQTIEHVAEPEIFINSLLSIGKGLVISTTLDTPYGLIPGHIHDPIDIAKFKSWFPVELDCWSVCSHPTNKKIGHIIAVIKDNHPNKT
jgi:2-polyprenyl-3-methyl-5-hydroxy-6-metoxy-1,4-benzoquinol methylase